MQAICQYLFTEDLLLAAYRMHARGNVGYWIFRLLTLLIGLSIVGLATAGYYISIHHHQIEPSMQNNLLAIVLFFLGMWFVSQKKFKEWSFIDHVKSHDQYGVQVIWTITRERLECSGEGYQASHVWSQVVKAVEHQHGFLIYLDKHLFYYLPFSGFLEGTDFDFVRGVIPRGVLQPSLAVRYRLIITGYNTMLDRYPQIRIVFSKIKAFCIEIKIKMGPVMERVRTELRVGWAEIKSKYPQIDENFEKLSALKDKLLFKKHPITVPPDSEQVPESEPVAEGHVGENEEEIR